MSVMQKVGDVCEGCRERWEEKEQEPKVLQKLPNATMNHKVIVPACEYCDGDVLVIAAMGNHDELEEA
jgi:hypothetical protein